MVRAALALLALGSALAVASGCGEEEGVADGGTVTAYLEAPLCAAPSSGSATVAPADGGSYRVRFVCLPAAGERGGEQLGLGVGGARRVDLARAGANARRATEDSSAVAYLAPENAAITRFTGPILAAAGIGQIAVAKRSAGVSRLLGMLAAADSSDPRAAVREALDQ